MGIVGGYPEDKARGIAIKALCEWCDAHPFSGLRVMLICGTEKRSEEYSNSYERFDEEGRKTIESSIDELILINTAFYGFSAFFIKAFIAITIFLTSLFCTTN